MIKFFRKIRQKLISENRMKKYLFYAIGEIALVMIGILLALQINNWNEERKQLAYGQEILHELIAEVNKNISSFNWASENLKEGIEIQESMFKIEDLRGVSSDSLWYLFSMANIDIKVSTNTFEKIKNQGLTRLSSNDSLNKKINEYFDKHIILFNKGIDFFWKRYEKRGDYLAFTNAVEYNSEYIVGLDKVSEETIRKELFEFINLPRTKNHIEMIYFDAQSVLRRTEGVKKVSIDLVRSIHQELSKSNPDIEPLPDFGSL